MLLTVRFLYDKRLTYTLAQEVGVAMPYSQVPGSGDQLASLELDFPVVLKPAISERLIRITNRKAFVPITGRNSRVSMRGCRR
jgi:D-aspartate ligase